MGRTMSLKFTLPLRLRGLFSGSLAWGILSSAAAKPTAGNSWVGNRSDSLPQQLDRAQDRGDHHDHRAGDAHCQNVI